MSEGAGPGSVANGDQSKGREFIQQLILALAGAFFFSGADI